MPNMFAPSRFSSRAGSPYSPPVKLEDESPPPLPGHCLNCGTALQGKFCHACGQRDFDFRRSFWSMLHEALESLFHVDGRFTRSVVELLFVPGRLTRGFLLGKRSSQVPPLRLYLFVTLVYFITLPLRTDFTVPELRLPEPEPTAEAAVAEGVETPTRPDPTPRLATENDELEAAFSGFLRSFEERRGQRDFRLPTREEILETLGSTIPKILFVILPLLALCTRVLFWRHRYSYLEHLVIALHSGAFFFTFTMMVEGWSTLLAFAWEPLAAFVELVAGAYVFFYLPLALHRIFRAGIWGTLWRSCLLYTALGFAFFTGAIFILVLFIRQSGLAG